MDFTHWFAERIKRESESAVTGGDGGLFAGVSKKDVLRIEKPLLELYRKEFDFEVLGAIGVNLRALPTVTRVVNCLESYVHTRRFVVGPGGFRNWHALDMFEGYDRNQKARSTELSGLYRSYGEKSNKLLEIYLDRVGLLRR